MPPILLSILIKLSIGPIRFIQYLASIELSFSIKLNLRATNILALILEIFIWVQIEPERIVQQYKTLLSIFNFVAYRPANPENSTSLDAGVSSHKILFHQENSLKTFCPKLNET